MINESYGYEHETFTNHQEKKARITMNIGLQIRIAYYTSVNRPWEYKCRKIFNRQYVLNEDR